MPDPVAPVSPGVLANMSIEQRVAALEAKIVPDAEAVRTVVVNDFKALAGKVGRTAAYVIVAAALMFVGHVL